MPATTLTNRTFGVEIECYNVTRAALKTALAAEGIASTVAGYDHITRRQWALGSDSSISGRRGCEITSPVLSGEDGLAQLATVLRTVHSMGGLVNRSCGLHVHIGASDLSLDELKTIAKGWVKFEEAIDTFVPPSRRGNVNGYCRSNKARYSSEADAYAAINAAPNVQELAGVVQGGRTYKLNLTPLWRQGTLEIRHHSGSVEAEKVCNWVRFCLLFVESYREGTPRPWTKALDLRTQTSRLFGRLGDSELAKFYRARQKELGSVPATARRPRQAPTTTVSTDDLAAANAAI